MRRKIATLEIWEDDSIRASKNGCETTMDGKPTGKWIVTVNPNEKLPNGTPVNKFTALAHEMGHFFAQLMKTPAALADMDAGIATKTAFGSQYLQAILYGKEKYASEREAWDIARMIYPGLNEYAASEALATYRKFST